MRAPDHDVYCFVEPLQFNRHSRMCSALMLRQHEAMIQLNMVEENYFLNKPHLEAILSETK